MDYYKTTGYLRIKAAMNRKYAEANRETFARTGGKGGSLYMADLHDACAEIAGRQANTQSLSTYIYWSIQSLV